MELWDAYDENFNIINGVTLVSAEEFKAYSKGSLEPQEFWLLSKN